MEVEETQLANTTIQFMVRVQLQGQEVPAFNQVMEWLHSKTQPTE